jgi:hypothetical protein
MCNNIYCLADSKEHIAVSTISNPDVAIITEDGPTAVAAADVTELKHADSTDAAEISFPQVRTEVSRRPSILNARILVLNTRHYCMRPRVHVYV